MFSVWFHFCFFFLIYIYTRNENDYQNFLGQLIIQNETLTQLKKEIEYKLKKLKVLKFDFHNIRINKI